MLRSNFAANYSNPPHLHIFTEIWWLAVTLMIANEHVLYKNVQNDFPDFFRLDH